MLREWSRYELLGGRDYEKPRLLYGVLLIAIPSRSMGRADDEFHIRTPPGLVYPASIRTHISNDIHQLDIVLPGSEDDTGTDHVRSELAAGVDLPVRKYHEQAPEGVLRESDG